MALICSNAHTNKRFVTPSSHLDVCTYAASRLLVFHSCFLVLLCPLMKSQKMNCLTEAHIFVRIQAFRPTLMVLLLPQTFMHSATFAELLQKKADTKHVLRKKVWHLREAVFGFRLLSFLFLLFFFERS